MKFQFDLVKEKLHHLIFLTFFSATAPPRGGGGKAALPNRSSGNHHFASPFLFTVRYLGKQHQPKEREGQSSTFPNGKDAGQHHTKERGKKEQHDPEGVTIAKCQRQRQRQGPKTQATGHTITNNGRNNPKKKNDTRRSRSKPINETAPPKGEGQESSTTEEEKHHRKKRWNVGHKQHRPEKEMEEHNTTSRRRQRPLRQRTR